MNAQQIRAILWLRWRLTRNQWRRGGRVQFIIINVLAAAGLIGAVASAAFGLWIGFQVLSGGEMWKHVLVWDIAIAVFLFVYVIGIVAQIQRSESIDMNRLLHYPVSLRPVFFLNYLISLFVPSLILFVPGTIGLTLGLMVGSGWQMSLLFFPLAGLIFMVTAWTYCLRGWLSALMVNKRRRRAIITAITFAVIVVSQIPNLALNNPWARDWIRSLEQANRPQPTVESAPDPKPAGASKTPRLTKADREKIMTWVRRLHYAVPVLWMGAAARELQHGHFGFVAAVSAGCGLVGFWGLRRAEVLSFRFYRAEYSKGTTSTAPAPAAPARARSQWMNRRLPGCSEEVSALTLAFFRSLLRAPEIKMTLIMPFVMLVVFASLHFSRGASAPDPSFRPLIFAGAAVFAAFGITQLAANQFGMDRDGFRLLVLLPVQRRRILLAKNLALLPVALALGGILLTILVLLYGASPAQLLAAMMQLITAWMVVCLVGNFVSVRAPYRVEPGTLKPTKVSSVNQFIGFFLYLLIPLSLLPVTIPPLLEWGLQSLRLPGASLPVNLCGTTLLTAAAGFFYLASLPEIGKMMARHEQTILGVVTREVE